MNEEDKQIMIDLSVLIGGVSILFLSVCTWALVIDQQNRELNTRSELCQALFGNSSEAIVIKDGTIDCTNKNTSK